MIFGIEQHLHVDIMRFYFTDDVSLQDRWRSDDHEISFIYLLQLMII